MTALLFLDWYLWQPLPNMHVDIVTAENAHANVPATLMHTTDKWMSSLISHSAVCIGASDHVFVPLTNSQKMMDTCCVLFDKISNQSNRWENGGDFAIFSFYCAECVRTWRREAGELPTVAQMLIGLLGWLTGRFLWRQSTICWRSTQLINSIDGAENLKNSMNCFLNIILWINDNNSVNTVISMNLSSMFV